VAGLDPVIYGFDRPNFGQASGNEGEHCSVIRLFGLEGDADLSLPRVGVDGRVKPGHDNS
jgi:hypothetical protein